jgi:RNA polymerase sigma-70 factor (ECF subfamily)
LKESDPDIEKEIVVRFISGSEQAYEVIFNRTKGKLKGFLKKALPKDEDAESVMQDIYLKLWTARKFIQPDKNFETYLFAIARNLLIDLMRKRLHKQRYLEELCRTLQEDQTNNLDTKAVVEYSELEKMIIKLIDQLPEKRREIFRLNRLEGLTYKEIAEKLHISENTVDSQMRKALAYFHIEMKHYLGLILWWHLYQ